MFIGPLEMFLSKFEFDSSASVSSKVEKWAILDTAISDLHIYCFLLFCFALFCLIFNSKLFRMTVGNRLIKKIKPVSSGDFLSTTLLPRLKGLINKLMGRK